MNVLSVINAITTCFFFSAGLFAFLIYRKSIIHKLFSLLCLCFAIWTFCAIFIFSTADKEISTMMYKISCIGFFFFFSVNLHFCIKLSGFRIKAVFYFLLYLFPLVFSIMTFIDYTVYVFFIRYNDTWIIAMNNKSIWNMAYSLYGITTMILCIVFLSLWSSKSTLKKVKKQSLLLVFGNIIVTGFGFLTAYGLLFFFNFSNLAISPLFPVFWLGLAFYAITKYQFLSLTPDKISTNILTEIDDSVLFMNQKYRIITVNQKLKNLLKLDNPDLVGRDARGIIHNFGKVGNEIEKTRKNDYNSFSCRINFLTKSQEKILMDAKVSLVKDKFDDITGILIISREVKELKQFKAFYKITNREAQIIENVIYGKTNKQMSIDLNISENTIKTHIVNIYNKLCVNNRMELLNLIKEFNLFPAKSADKTLMFFNEDN